MDYSNRKRKEQITTNMTKTNYITNIQKGNHSTFGGNIYFSDFDTNHANGNIANRIVQDWAFDMQCKRNIELRNKTE